MSYRPLPLILRYAVLVVGMLFILVPMYVTITVALKTPAESAQNFFSLPSRMYLGNFEEVIREKRFFTYLTNSVYITCVSVLLMLIVIPMAAFAISRNYHKRHYRLLYALILSSIFVPFQTIMLPIFRHLFNLHLLNQHGLILMHLTLALSEGVFLCVGFLKNIPLELDEAAKIDGCGIGQLFVRIIYPLMRPIIVTLLILNALWVWNDFLLPLIVLNRHPDYWTLPLFIYNFKSEYSFDYNLAFAGFFITMLPIIILYGFLQRHIIAGLTEGAFK